MKAGGFSRIFSMIDLTGERKSFWDDGGGIVYNISREQGGLYNVCLDSILISAFTASNIWFEAQISGEKCTKFTLNCEGCKGFAVLDKQTFELRPEDYISLVNDLASHAR